MATRASTLQAASGSPLSAGIVFVSLGGRKGHYPADDAEKVILSRRCLLAEGATRKEKGLPVCCLSLAFSVNSAWSEKLMVWRPWSGHPAKPLEKGKECRDTAGAAFCAGWRNKRHDPARRAFQRGNWRRMNSNPFLKAGHLIAYFNIQVQCTRKV